MGKGVIFTTTLIALSGFNPHPGHVVAFLDKTLYDDYLCLVASNKQQIQGIRFLRIHRNIGSSETPEQVRIPQSRSGHCNKKCADHPIISVWRPEDKYALTTWSDRDFCSPFMSVSRIPFSFALQKVSQPFCRNYEKK